ncbi:MAG TPA: hypothetical protein VEU11_05085 [Terriglobales bacterium]|nr:hypothetical protein [Terriglobales bacterium]
MNDYPIPRVAHGKLYMICRTDSYNIQDQNAKNRKPLDIPA